MIRHALMPDIPHLLEIEKLSFPLCDRFNYHQFRHAIRKAKGILLIDSEYDNFYKGYIYVLNSGRIYSLAVHPDYRNKKIAKGLLNHAENILHTKPKVILEVRKDNRIAQCFYLKNGYKYVKIKHNYYSDGMDAIVMKKDLYNAKGRLVTACNTL